MRLGIHYQINPPTLYMGGRPDKNAVNKDVQNIQVRQVQDSGRRKAI